MSPVPFPRPVRTGPLMSVLPAAILTIVVVLAARPMLGGGATATSESAAGLAVRATGSGAVGFGSVTDRVALPPREAGTGPVRVRWSGYWHLAEAAEVRFAAAVTGRVRVRVGGRLLLDRSSEPPGVRRDVARRIEAGPQRILVTYRGPGGARALDLTFTRDGDSSQRLRPEHLSPLRRGGRLSTDAIGAPARPPRLNRVGVAAQVALLFVIVAASIRWALRAGGEGRSRRLDRVAGWTLAAAATAIWIWILWSWFRDPGRARPGNMPGREADLAGLLAMLGVCLLTLAIRGREWLRRAVVEMRELVPVGRDRVLLVLLLVLACVWHWPVWRYPAGFLDSDSALLGLAGLRLLDGAPVPPFVYSGLYSGNLSAHMVALVGGLGTPSAADLVLVTRGLWLLVLTLQFVMLRRAFGIAPAVGAVGWLAMTPAFLMRALTNGEYAESVTLAAVVLVLLAHRVGTSRGSDAWLPVAGLFTGLAGWAQLGALPGLAGAWLVALWLRPPRSSSSVAATVLASCWGLAPVAVGWWGETDAVIAWLAEDAAGGLAVPWSARVAAVARVFADDAGAGLAGWLAAAGILGAVSWALSAARRPDDASAATRMLLGAAAVGTLAAFALTGWGDGPESARYLLPLCLAVPALVAALVHGVAHPRLGRRGAVVVVAAMLVWSAAGWSSVRALVRTGIERGAVLESAIVQLRESGLRRCYAPYWEAYLISYLSLETIRCDSLDVEQIDLYREDFIGSPEFPYVARVALDLGALAGIESRLREQRIPYRIVETTPWVALIPEPAGPRPDESPVERPSGIRRR